MKRRGITLFGIKLKHNIVFSFIPNRVIPHLFTLCFSFIPELFLFFLCCVLVLYQSYSSSLYVVLSFIPNRVIKEMRNNSVWYKTKHNIKRRGITLFGIKLKHNIKRRGITLFGIKLKHNIKRRGISLFGIKLKQSYSSSLYVVF
jgi:hypothetical protein